MLTIFRDRAKGPEASPTPEMLAQAVWIDALNPTDEEKAQVKAATGLYVSSRAELSEIESSSRFYEDEGAIYLSLPAIAAEPGEFCVTAPTGFVLTPERVLTVRFNQLPTFQIVAQRISAAKNPNPPRSASVLLALLEALIEVMADTLEHVRGDLDGVSAEIFGPGSHDVGRARTTQLQRALQVMGLVNDRISRVRDSLLVFHRIIPYVTQSTEEWFPKDLRPRLKTLRQDVASLSDYDNHLTDKLQFLLDAVLGFITINQSNIIKVMTVVGVVGVPPTLIASIYGMNFENMPELHTVWGYPAALLAILASAILPLLWFRHRGWL